MKNAATILSFYVFNKLSAEPVHPRITLTRALAAIEPYKKKQAALHAIANQLEKTERAHVQMLPNYCRRQGGQS